MHGQCVRCGMVTSLHEFRRTNGAPELAGGRWTGEPFRLLDLAFTGQCGHEPEYQMHGHCIRCGMVTSLDEAMKARDRFPPGQPPSARRRRWPPMPGT